MSNTHARSAAAGFVALLLAAGGPASSRPQAEAPRASVATVSITVDDMDRALAFCTGVLPFTKLSDEVRSDASLATLTGSRRTPSDRPAPARRRSDRAGRLPGGRRPAAARRLAQQRPVVPARRDRSCRTWSAPTPRLNERAWSTSPRCRSASPTGTLGPGGSRRSTFTTRTSTRSTDAPVPAVERAPEVASRRWAPFPRDRSHGHRREGNQAQPGLLPRCGRASGGRRRYQLRIGAGAAQERGRGRACISLLCEDRPDLASSSSSTLRRATAGRRPSAAARTISRTGRRSSRCRGSRRWPTGSEKRGSRSSRPP